MGRKPNRVRALILASQIGASKKAVKISNGASLDADSFNKDIKPKRFQKKSKVMKIFILICMMVSSGLSAQYWRAYLGAHWSGGLSYDMEHELPSGEIGAQMALSDFNSISIGVRVFMNIRPETITPTNSFYNIYLPQFIQR